MTTKIENLIDNTPLALSESDAYIVDSLEQYIGNKDERSEFAYNTLNGVYATTDYLMPAFSSYHVSLVYDTYTTPKKKYTTILLENNKIDNLYIILTEDIGSKGERVINVISSPMTLIAKNLDASTQMYNHMWVLEKLATKPTYVKKVISQVSKFKSENNIVYNVYNG